jgi:hypothetical protein
MTMPPRSAALSSISVAVRLSGNLCVFLTNALFRFTLADGTKTGTDHVKIPYGIVGSGLGNQSGRRVSGPVPLAPCNRSHQLQFAIRSRPN